MKKHIKNIAVIILALAFNFLFWKEGLGLNTLIFSTISILGLFILRRGIFKNRSMQIITLGTWLASAAIVYNNSLFAQIIFILSYVLMLGYSQENRYRFLGHGFIVGIWSYLETPYKLFDNIFSSTPGNFRVGKKIKLFIIPTIVFTAFLIIYMLANDRFASLAFDFLTDFISFLKEMDISWHRIFFILIGFIFAGGIFYKNKAAFGFDENPENLKRTRRSKNKKPLISFSAISLKNEYKTAIITILSLNALLFLVNLTDINFVWMADVNSLNIWELKSYVYQGTYVLIFSILMAMAVLIYFFRKNINFYPNNGFLKIISYIWILQNAILVISVGIRNYRYIEYYGIAHKRIGVFIFLLLTLAGLTTMILKIKNKKSLHFLLNRNAWIWYITFIILSWINWDIHMTKYNITVDYNNKLDTEFIFHEISDKNLYLLEEYGSTIMERGRLNSYEFRSKMDQKTYKFNTKLNERTWRSWNLPDYKNSKIFRK